MGEESKTRSTSNRQFSIRHVLFFFLAISILLALVVQLRHVGFVAFCFLAVLAAGCWTRNLRLSVSSLTALLVFAITYLASWTQIGYMHRMGSPHPYEVLKMRAIREALLTYAESSGTFPESLGELESASVEIDQHLLLDGWNHPFQYKRTSDGFELVSLGRDGENGGVGLDADVLFDEDSDNSKSIGLPLAQFVFETAGSNIVFWSAFIASLIAGFIWFSSVDLSKSTRGKPLVVGIIVTTISAVIVAGFLAAFHVALSQSGH